MTLESLISQLLYAYQRYRKLRGHRQLYLTVIFCTVGFLSRVGIAAPSAITSLTERDKRLLDILEASGRTLSDALLSEQYSLRNNLKREYLRQFRKPFAESILELALHHESSPEGIQSFAAQLQSDSSIQLGNNFEARMGWSVLAFPNAQHLLPQEPSLAPRLSQLTVGYGKMRTVEFTLGLPREFSVLGRKALPPDFSGAAIKIHRLKDRIQPVGSSFGFEIEHTWAAPPVQNRNTIRSLHIQRTRPRLSFVSNGKRLSLSGRATLEWYTDPDDQLERLATWRTDDTANTAETISPNWRLFALESGLKFTSTSEIFGQIDYQSVRNTLAKDSKSSWNASTAIGRRFRFAGVEGTAQLSLSAFEITKNSVPAARLAPELHPQTRGGLAEVSIGLQPRGDSDSALKFELTYLRDTDQDSTSTARLCQGTNIVGKSECSITAVKLSWTTFVLPNL